METITIRDSQTGQLIEVERVINAKESGLTEAGVNYMFGYLANADPELAAKALHNLKQLAADGPPGYWIK